MKNNMNKEAKKAMKEAKRESRKATFEPIKNGLKAAGREIAADAIGAATGTMVAGSLGMIAGGISYIASYNYYSKKGVPVLVKKHRFSKLKEANSKNIGKCHTVINNSFWVRPETAGARKIIAATEQTVKIGAGTISGVATRNLMKETFNIMDEGITMNINMHQNFSDITEEEAFQEA